MNVEAEKVIQDVQRVQNEFEPDGEMKRAAVRYFTAQERSDREGELQQLDSTLSLTPRELAAINMTPERLAGIRTRRKRLKRELDNYSPPTDLKGETRDELHRMENELAAKIQDGMLPREVMRKNPVGAVDQNVKWMAKTKAIQLVWKNIRRLLHPDSEEKDLANLERLRPEMYARGAPSGFMGDAQITGHFSNAHIPDERWTGSGLPLVNENSPLAQAERREREELENQIKALEARLAAAEKPAKAKGRVSAEQKKASSERMKQFWADKKAKQPTA